MLRTVLDRLAVRVLKNFGDYFNLRACLASWLFVLEAAFGLKLVEFGVFDHKGVFGLVGLIVLCHLS